jgi:hypothetical protein
MRILLIVIALAALPSATVAEPSLQDRKPTLRAQPSGAAPRAVQRNPCAAFGPGFVQLDGSATCVKLGGDISVGAGTTR